MPTVLRRLLLWTIICVVSAAPSFLFAQEDFSRPAMALGVCLFIVAYTATTSTAAFERFHRRPFVRRTLYIGYGARLLLSLSMPIGMLPLMPLTGFLIFPDVLPGIVSVQVVEATGLDPESFAGTLATTIVQGTLLNVIIFLFMLVVWGFQRLFMKMPPESAPRGFEPVLPAQPVSEPPVR